MSRDPRTNPKPGDQLALAGVKSAIEVLEIWPQVQVTWMHVADKGYPSSKHNHKISDWDEFMRWARDAQIIRAAHWPAAQP